MTQLILHLIGDYLTQSDWMAIRKTSSTWAAFVHATVYSAPFLLIGGWRALLVIWSTHLLIDRFRLARYVVWAKNFLSPPVWWMHMKTGEWASASNQQAAMWRTWIDGGYGIPQPEELKGVLTFSKERMLPFSVCAGTGYPPDRPAWLAVWLLIIADNTMHLAINWAALKWL